ncbi:monoamine oxidase [Conyzicola lurida]|uniref:Monoamine oxidase n=1 Tax=Conyzicola lurida TaxID=1172621 RepID=A0A841AGY4_9MICO|nr:NAD(P)/FAD-dependent oxidoreductase [Conyzicola lurida]MBB5843090.1 monoamine oxidase [Conyzicola lurida]
MSFTRRTFLAGAGTGVSVLVLTACTVDAEPSPTPTPTRTATGVVPVPRATARSNWGADSFARGSTSYMTVGSTLEHREALRVPVDDRVFFAGEATSTDNPGTVVGAQRSGNLAAAALADAGDSSEKVAIIGAGAAGSEAARVLTLRGYSVSVIEARSRVGGRIHSVSGKAWPFPIELGAFRLSPLRDADVLDALGRLDVATVSLDSAEDGTVYRSATGESATDPVSPAALATALDWAQSQSRDQSVDSSLTASGAEQTVIGATAGELDGPGLLAQHLAYLATVYGADGADLSSWYTADSVDTPTVVTGGFSEIVSDSLEGVETYLSTTVVGVSYTDERVSLRLGTGESLTVDRVLVTVPLGVLQDDSIEFDPLLPFSHRTAIASLAMGTVDTVWLRFDEPFWTTDAVVWNLVGTDDEVTTWYNLEPVTGEAILVGVVGGEAAERVQLLDDDELVDRLLTTLAPFAG